MVDMSDKRVYEGGSLQGFNVVSQMYPSGAGCKGFCGGGSMESVSVAYGNGENMAHGGVLSMRWYEISWRDRGFEGRGLYEGVVHKRIYSLSGVRSSGVVGYVGIGVDIDDVCDGFIVDRVMMEWRVMVEGLNGMG